MICHLCNESPPHKAEQARDAEAFAEEAQQSAILRETKAKQHIIQESKELDHLKSLIYVSAVSNLCTLSALETEFSVLEMTDFTLWFHKDCKFLLKELLLLQDACYQ